MRFLIATWPRRLGWSLLALVLAFWLAIWLTGQFDPDFFTKASLGGLMMRILGLPVLMAIFAFGMLTGCAMPTAATAADGQLKSATNESAKPFMAQVVGVQWLNPLQRRDYPTEWQLLWTLGLAKPNKNDDMVKMNPKKYSAIQPVAGIANANDGEETFKGFQWQYISEMTGKFHDVYATNGTYFYNIHDKNPKKWRELAGIHVEYAIPQGRLIPAEARDSLVKDLVSTFDIGNPHFPDLWTRATPPDVRITVGGANAGFTSLFAALDYLQAHPSESVWVMNWDAPNFPKDEQLNENLVLLVLTGPTFNTEREPLAWIGYPASKSVDQFEAKKGEPPRVVQAWKATLDAAAHNVDKTSTDIGYVIHDAHNTHADSSDRIGALAQTLTTELVEFDYLKQSFNTPALLGDMGAGTALTDVALAIGYANHIGKNVLVAGTTDAAHPVAVMVLPPAKVRPIDPDRDWFRARGGGTAYLPWWGLRHDAEPMQQGYSR